MSVTVFNVKKKKKKGKEMRKKSMKRKLSANKSDRDSKYSYECLTTTWPFE